MKRSRTILVPTYIEVTAPKPGIFQSVTNEELLSKNVRNRILRLQRRAAKSQVIVNISTEKGSCEGVVG